MKIIEISIPTTLNECPTSIDEIHIFTQFFIHKNNRRQHELLSCLKNNYNNPFITNIHLLNEKIYSWKEMGIDDEKDNKIKIIQTSIGKRLRFQDIFYYIRKNSLKGYFIFTNADIFFDSTIQNVKKSTLHEKKQMFALLRYEYNGISTEMSPLFGPRFDSQDTWIFHSNHIINILHEKIFNFEFGKPGCDNKMIYLMKILGYQIINDPFFIKTYHYHLTQIRDYSNKDCISNPWGCIVPCNINPLSIPSSLGINLHELAIKKQTICFEDNDVLREYIQNKIQNKSPFIIPRISGIENNVAVFVNEFDSLKQYYLQILPIMKSNAGIKLSSLSSIQNYSKQYLEAFDHCDLFCGWELQGNYIHHIADSHQYMTKKYSSKKMIWAFTLDIFHYIYSLPWTIALKGKRILIISSFIDSISENINNRTKIYDGIDLFPDCTFVFIKPPITFGNENSQEFDIELNIFYQRLDLVKNDYDVALLACGGYANLICNYIYKYHQQSAIYVGGVLQMYFGVFGNRWLIERKDVIQLYHNEYWIRPKESEKPKEWNKIENACYW